MADTALPFIKASYLLMSCSLTLSGSIGVPLSGCYSLAPERRPDSPGWLGSTASSESASAGSMLCAVI